jgi:Domain of unknown function (DUF6378)
MDDEVVTDIEAILEQRHSVHGDFHQDARIAQALKYVMREGVNWSDLTDIQKEALDHFATKIARILAGDPNHVDHWEDICGYATLNARALRVLHFRRPGASVPTA